MRKLIFAFFALFSLASCDVNADFSGTLAVDNIEIRPVDWQMGDGFLYSDVRVVELTSATLSNDSYVTYFKYMDGDTPIQEALPIVNVDGTHDITAEYSPGYLRIILRPYALPFPVPTETLVFRLAIIR